MASLDWSQCSAVESIPGKVSGAWLFRDTRMPVSIVFENLQAGADQGHQGHAVSAEFTGAENRNHRFSETRNGPC